MIALRSHRRPSTPGAVITGGRSVAPVARNLLDSWTALKKNENLLDKRSDSPTAHP